MDAGVLMEVKAPTGWTMRLMQFDGRSNRDYQKHLARAARNCKEFMHLNGCVYAVGLKRKTTKRGCHGSPKQKTAF